MVYTFSGTFVQWTTLFGLVQNGMYLVIQAYNLYLSYLSFDEIIDHFMDLQA